jgi:hypothetical protein
MIATEYTARQIHPKSDRKGENLTTTIVNRKSAVQYVTRYGRYIYVEACVLLHIKKSTARFNSNVATK